MRTRTTSPTAASRRSRGRALAGAALLAAVVLGGSPTAQALDRPGVTVPTGLTGLTGLTGTVAAAEVAEPTVRFGLSPAPVDGQARDRVELQVEPGGSATDQVSVVNLSEVDLTFDVYPADAVITRDGDITVAARATPLDGVGLWIGLDVDQVLVPAGKRVDVPFRVTVPADATPGDHVGALLAALPAPPSDGSASQVVVDLRAGARVHVVVPGAVENSLALTASDLEYHPARGGLGVGELVVTYVVENTGNLRQSAVVAARPTALGGLWTGPPVTVDIAELLPGQQLEVTETLAGAPPLAWATVTLDLEAAADDGYVAAPSASATISGWAAPWVLASAALLLAALVVRAVRGRAHRPAALPHETAPSVASRA